MFEAWANVQEAKDRGSSRKQLFDHGQATVSGLAALPPLVRLQPNHCELQTTKYPIKHSSDEYQMCNCGSLWTQVENLQISKAALGLYATKKKEGEVVWSHIIKVRSLNHRLSCLRGFTFGKDLITCSNTSKTELPRRSKTIVFSLLANEPTLDCANGSVPDSVRLSLPVSLGVAAGCHFLPLIAQGSKIEETTPSQNQWYTCRKGPGRIREHSFAAIKPQFMSVCTFLTV